MDNRGAFTARQRQRGTISLGAPRGYTRRTIFAVSRGPGRASAHPRDTCIHIHTYTHPRARAREAFRFYSQERVTRITTTTTTRSRATVRRALCHHRRRRCCYAEYGAVPRVARVAVIPCRGLRSEPSVLRYHTRAHTYTRVVHACTHTGETCLYVFHEPQGRVSKLSRQDDLNTKEITNICNKCMVGCILHKIFLL